MSPEERCAYLKAAHEKYKDGLLQAEPAVFRCIVNKFPRQYADYARDRCIFHDRLIAAGVSRRFFTFQDAYNYSTVEAPWIDVGMSGSREQRIARLQAMYSNGAEIDIKYLSGLHRSEWCITTTDLAQVTAFRCSEFSGILQSTDGIYKIHVGGQPASIQDFILRFQDIDLATRFL